MTTIFDKLTQRHGTNSVKWDEPEADGVLPMWVADMDFEAAPCIRQALQRRLDHGIFGYACVPQSYYKAVVDWFARRHNWRTQPQWIIYTSGVVPAISAVIKALAQPGEKVLVQTPVYNCFFSSIRNNGCELCDNPLVYADRTYHIDFDDFERKAADPTVRLFLLCNPHNPAGRVWTADELQRMNEICKRNDVTVISDEIHCELTMPGHDYTPFASISKECSDNCITLCSPTKAFNIAGLQIANIITSNAEWRRRIDRAININEVCDVNPFGIEALQAAYNEGDQWLDELRAYLHGNYKELSQYFASRMPNIGITHLEGTYLVWADIRSTGLTSDELAKKLLDEGRVMVNSGTLYGQESGEGFIRINIACPRSRMMEGLRRMESVMKGL